MGRGKDRDTREGRPVEPGEARERGNDPDAVRIEEGSDQTAGDAASGQEESTSQAQPTGETGQHTGTPPETSPNADVGPEGRGTDDLDLRTDPDQDAGSWRARGPLTERYSRGGHGASLAADDGERGGDRAARRDTDRGTSWASVVFGWLAALGASLILSAIVGAVVGAILVAVGVGESAAISGLVGAVVTLLLAFLVGGYVAGRMASRSGLKHGLLVALLAVVVAVLLALAGGALGAGFSGVLGNAVPPGLTQAVPTSAPQGLGTAAIVSGVLALLAPFVGGAIGGLWGAKRGRERP